MDMMLPIWPCARRVNQMKTPKIRAIGNRYQMSETSGFWVVVTYFAFGPRVLRVACWESVTGFGPLTE
jgi:hypothetical protein